MYYNYHPRAIQPKVSMFGEHFSLKSTLILKIFHLILLPTPVFLDSRFVMENVNVKTSISLCFRSKSLTYTGILVYRSQVSNNGVCYIYYIKYIAYMYARTENPFKLGFKLR